MEVVFRLSVVEDVLFSLQEKVHQLFEILMTRRSEIFISILLFYGFLQQTLQLGSRLFV
jgi:hypothetical protein